MLSSTSIINKTKQNVETRERDEIHKRALCVLERMRFTNLSTLIHNLNLPPSLHYPHLRRHPLPTTFPTASSSPNRPSSPPIAHIHCKGYLSVRSSVEAKTGRSHDTSPIEFSSWDDILRNATAGMFVNMRFINLFPRNLSSANSCLNIVASSSAWAVSWIEVASVCFTKSPPKVA